MEVTHYVIWAYLLLATLLACICFAKPAPQFFYESLESYENDDRHDVYHIPYGEPLTNYRLSRLRRGYYFVDDGFITAVPASAVVPNSVTAVAAAARRQDDENKSANGAHYRPVVSYRQERTKHKKLFVPNLYG